MYRNCKIWISFYIIVHFIFPHSNTSINRILDEISYPITSCKDGKIPEETRRFFQRIETEFTHKIQRWQEYKTTRSISDDFFKLKKDGVSMDCLHCYTMRSVHKFISIDALLAGTIALIGYNTKEKLQRLSES